MSLQESSIFVACLALFVSVGALIYNVTTSRRTRYIHAELSEQQTIGRDAWIAKHIQRWRDGKLPSRIENGVGVSGADVEIIEPLPGWKIVVATLVDGKPVPSTAPAHEIRHQGKS